MEPITPPSRIPLDGRRGHLTKRAKRVPFPSIPRKDLDSALGGCVFLWRQVRYHQANCPLPLKQVTKLSESDATIDSEATLPGLDLG
jgi:hypothetical protein